MKTDDLIISTVESRERVQRDLIEWLRAKNGRWSAPYGILESKSPDRRYRSVTFGIARTLDTEVRIYSMKYFILHSSRDGWLKFTSFRALTSFLEEQYL